MTQPPVTRRILARELMLNAASRPLNIAVLLGVVAAAFVLTPWLAPVAVLAYAALVAATFLDGDVAESIGRDVYARKHLRRPPTRHTSLSKSAAASLALAYQTERQIQMTLDESPVPLPEIEAEVKGLLHELEHLARHVDRLTKYLGDDDESALRARIERANPVVAATLEQQFHARTQLSLRVDQFEAQMEHIAATLGFVRTQIMRMTAAEAASAQTRVAEQIRHLRREVDTSTAAFDEAYRELDE
jgi:uncharacterized protein YoxC/type IV secretory pathway TrbD component